MRNLGIRRVNCIYKDGDYRFFDNRFWNILDDYNFIVIFFYINGRNVFFFNFFIISVNIFLSDYVRVEDLDIGFLI